MKLQRPRANSAFTLVELSVVIAIIGILTALLLTTISKVKGRAYQIQCINNVHQLGLALHTFVQENHEYPLNTNVEVNKGEHSEHYSNWTEALSYEALGIPKSEFAYFTNGVWNCPTARWNKNQGSLNSMNIWFSYGYNYLGLNSPGKNEATGLGGQTTTIYGPLAPPVGESAVVAPADMIAIGDAFDSAPSLQRGSWDFAQQVGNPPARHQGKANVVFCDGHVESPTLKFLFEDTSDAALSRWNRDHLPHREKLLP
jgi:prepilin-type processing-associated H-X9-DG protein/prepilin-type N-terminal cleavage/methylation domain-containing protein